ncbi:MAG: hypothetical protein AAGI03_04655 [Pseudomonadota bacterium]
MRHALVDEIVAEYLLAQIGGGDPQQAKRALQDVCSLHARGFHFKPHQRVTLEITTVGQLEAQRFDRKVRRWCLNVLALIGTPERSKDAIQRVIETFHNDPDTMASALTAFFKVSPDAYQDLSGRSFISPQQIALAAHIGDFGSRIRTDKTTIDIEKEDQTILCRALVAVGLNRAPENLFHPRYANADLVKKLSAHDQEAVMQYAVWAINENADLGVDHLAFDLCDLGTLPASIRGWTYRLYGEADVDHGLKHDVIVDGSKDFQAEARMNLARGLRETWYDGLEEITSPWWHEESEAAIREELLDHMVRHAGDCSEYKRLAVEQFDAALPNDPLLKRLRAAAAGTPLFARFRRMEYEDSGDLFGFGDTDERNITIMTTNNNVNIGNVQGGAVSVGGDAHQTGTNQNALTGDQTVQLKSELAHLADALKALPNQTQELKDVMALVADAADDPNPTKLAKVKVALSELFSGTAALAKFGGDATKIAALVEKVLPMIPF